MDLELLLGRLVAIVAIFGGLTTAIGTYLNSRNQTRESSLSVDKVRSLAPIEAAEKASSMYINLTEQLQEQLRECIIKRDELIKLMHENEKNSNVAKIKLRKLIFKLRDIREKHDKIYYDIKASCPGYDIINSMIDAIISEIESELEEGE